MSKFITTPERRANLVKLARFLYTEPIAAGQFDMEDFNSRNQCAVKIEHGCGTAGCAAGWGPTAGIEALEDEDWSDYTIRVFLPYGTEAERQAWWWCFSGGWEGHDNTPKGAAQRILWLLLGRVDLRTWTYQAGLEDYGDFEPTEADWQAAERGDA